MGFGDISWVSVQVCVVKSAGTPEQLVWMGTISTIVEVTSGHDLSPCVIVIGEVVSLAMLRDVQQA